jgi:hypothetical protein
MHLVEKIILSTLQRLCRTGTCLHTGAWASQGFVHFIVLCFTWSCFLYRSLNCTWTLLISTRTAPMSTQMASRSILTASMSTITDVSRGSKDAVDQTNPTTAEAAVGKTHPGNIVCCTDTSWAALTAVQIHPGQHCLLYISVLVQHKQLWNGYVLRHLRLVQDRHFQR